MKKIHTIVSGTDRTLCGKKVVGKVPPDDAEYCDSCTSLSRPDSKTGVLMAQAARDGIKVKVLKLVPTAEDLSGLPVKPARKELSKHDLDVVRRTVKTAMSGGYSQVYGWSGLGFKEHWADSIALGIVTNREGVVDTDWVHQVRLAVYLELGLDTVDVASPVRTSDLTGSKI